MYEMYTPPTNEFYMYHPQKAPEGKLFNGGEELQKELAESGWFDCPSKFGNNVWGPTSEEFVQTRKMQVDMGALKNLDSASFVDTEEIEAVKRKQMELDEREKNLKLQEDAFAKMRQAQVERADHLKGGELHPNQQKIEVPPIKRPVKKAAVKAKPKPEVDLNI